MCCLTVTVTTPGCITLTLTNPGPHHDLSSGLVRTDAAVRSAVQPCNEHRLSGPTQTHQKSIIHIHTIN